MCIRDSNNQIIVSNPPSIVQNQNHIHVQNQNQLQVNHTLVNAVLNPVHSYFNPLSHILSNSEVEQGLENMFKLESLGIELSLIHISEPTRLLSISYAVFCLKKK